MSTRKRKFVKSLKIREKYGASGERGARSFPQAPIVFSTGKGSRFLDMDKNEYIDYQMGFGALILGYGNRQVVRATKAALDRGAIMGAVVEDYFKVSQKIKKMVPCAEEVTYSVGGSTATDTAVRIARAFARKDKIIKFEGAYHGAAEWAMVNVKTGNQWPPTLEELGPADHPNVLPYSAGVPADAVKNTLILPWGNSEVLQKTIETQRDEIAGVIMEPAMLNIGAATPNPSFLRDVRRITKDNGVVLIFDEVVTGFRLAPGGAQEYFGVTPDLAAFSKAIANGLPLSAVAGKRDVMEVTHLSWEYLKNLRVDPGKIFGNYGTYSGHSVSLAGCFACLSQLESGNLQKRSQRLIEGFVKEIRDFITDMHLKIRIQNVGQLWTLYFTDREVVDYRSAITVNTDQFYEFHKRCMEHGVWLTPKPIEREHTSTAHTKEDIEGTVQAVESALKEMKDAGELA
jgi:glutamate-1-semialdehyde 2,1-aminomutase